MRVFVLSIFLSMWVSLSSALEINHYTTSISGIFHDVTVALDDLDKTARVRCVIKKEGKPVGIETQDINGVGTIQIVISGGVTENTTASCKELR